MAFTNDDRARHVADWRTSGQSRAAFCRGRGLPYHSFLDWIKRAATVPDVTGTEPAFIEVRRVPGVLADGAGSAEATVVFACGLSLRIAPGTDPAWIGRVVAAVRVC